MQRVATALAIAGLATLLTTRATAHLGAAHASVAATGPRAAHDAALAAAFGDAFRVLLVAAVVGAVLGLALRRPRAVPAT